MLTHGKPGKIQTINDRQEPRGNGGLIVAIWYEPGPEASWVLESLQFHVARRRYDPNECTEAEYG